MTERKEYIYRKVPQRYHDQHRGVTQHRCAKIQHYSAGCLGKMNTESPCLSTPECRIAHSSAATLKLLDHRGVVTNVRTYVGLAKRCAISISNCSMSASAAAKKTL
ncbi:hypothetical protein M5K25_026293 [Dendrobium thyrsiflorum]|uniref:Uncharacterized protein n=1 Tax=Dendrobium thyrsiflorum TaxID=117978 RepID=A0ABD0TX20_DENTH